MRKKHSILAIIGFTLTLNFSHSQIPQDTFYRNEINLDIASLFRPETSITVLYRKHFQKSSLRIKLSGTYSYSNFEQGNFDGQKKLIGVSNGYGWERDINHKKCQFYYGADALLSYQQEKLTGSTEMLTHIIKAGILPLLGYKFSINEKFSVGAEASAKTRYLKKH